MNLILSQFFCVRAEFIPIDSENPLNGFIVSNYENLDRVNGPVSSTSGTSNVCGPSQWDTGRFEASVDDPGDPSKLYISCNTTNALGEKYNSSAPYSGTIPMYAIIQPHWVVAIDEEDYQWAIVTAGRPYEESGDGKCIPLDARISGFWLLTREPVDPESSAVMMEVAEGLGLDTAKLVDVPQDGCLYEGAQFEEKKLIK